MVQGVDKLRIKTEVVRSLNVFIFVNYCDDNGKLRETEISF